jgi:hypothetical protein
VYMLASRPADRTPLPGAEISIGRR